MRDPNELTISTCIALARPELRFLVLQVLRRMEFVQIRTIFNTPDELLAMRPVPCGCKVIIIGMEEHEQLRGAAFWKHSPHGKRIVIAGSASYGAQQLGETVASGCAILSLARIDHELPLAITAAMAGVHVVSEHLRPDEAPTMPSTLLPAGAPSGREAEVLGLVGKGFGNREIAEHLGISTKTVETYKHRLKLRFGLQGRRDFVRLAMQMQATPVQP
jgi:DNA-binding NarL/FixJ family response regulator